MTTPKAELLASLAKALENAPEEVIQSMNERLEGIMQRASAEPTESQIPPHIMHRINTDARKLHDIVVVEMLQDGQKGDDDNWDDFDLPEKLYWASLISRLGLKMSEVRSSEEHEAYMVEVKSSIEAEEGDQCNCPLCQERRRLEKAQKAH